MINKLCVGGHHNMPPPRASGDTIYIMHAYGLWIRDNLHVHVDLTWTANQSGLVTFLTSTSRCHSLNFILPACTFTPERKVASKNGLKVTIGTEFAVVRPRTVFFGGFSTNHKIFRRFVVNSAKIRLGDWILRGCADLWMCESVADDGCCVVERCRQRQRQLRSSRWRHRDVQLHVARLHQRRLLINNVFHDVLNLTVYALPVDCCYYCYYYYFLIIIMPPPLG